MVVSYKDIENKFLFMFPAKLQDEQWIKIGKKHDSYKKIIEMFKNELSQKSFEEAFAKNDITKLIEASKNVIQRSTMVSTFDKIAFKNYISVIPRFVNNYSIRESINKVNSACISY